MKVTIEHSFCPYCDEVTELYFRIINTILFSGNEAELRESMRQLEKKTPLDEYFTYGYGARHLWVCQRCPSDKTKIFEHRIMMVEFQWHLWTNIIDWLEWNHPFQPYFHFPFITFSFGCATPFCRNQPFAQSELETTLWKVWFSLPFFLPVPFFFDADITILQGWAAYASIHSWLPHSLCNDLFSDWTVFCLLQSQFKPGMSRFGFAILHWLSDGCLAFVPTFGFALFPYHYRFTCFPFSIIAFYRSNHHFPLQR